MSGESKRALSALLNALNPAQKSLYKTLYGNRVIGPRDCLGDSETGTMEEEKMREVICGLHGLDVRGVDVTKLKPASRRIYPDLVKDDDFSNHLNSKREFHENASALSNKTIEEVCPSETQPFSLLPYQEYLVNFLSPLTPYRGVLVFHGVGTGKTYTSLAIAEGFKDTLRKNPTPQQRRVLIICLSNSINATYRSALYRPRAEESEKRNGMRPGSLHVTSNSYYVDDDRDALHRRERITKKYEEYYEIVSGDAFMKKVLSFIRQAKSSSPKAWEKVLKVALSDEYSNRVIIVDEVHGLKTHNDETVEVEDENMEYRKYEALYDVLKFANNIRLVLMSATPMFHSPSEIVGLANLLLLNDRQPLLDMNEALTSDITPSKAGIGSICDRLTPYVSYLRGYNPVSFPRQLEVNDDTVKDLYRHNKVYLPRPKFDLSQQELKPSELMKHTVLIKCTMSKFQFENYLSNKQTITSKMNVAHNATQKLCTIIYPLDEESGLTGSQGFENCFQKTGGNRLTKSWTYRYRPHCKDFLRMTNLQKFSSKYYEIVKNILRSPGLAYVYSDNISYGVETMAMILDANGYDRDGGGNYLSDNGCAKRDKVCSICNKTFSDVIHNKKGEELHTFQQAKYVILQHQESMQTNINIVERTKAPGNRRGEEIKVILGTPVTKESMDFHNIRQIHIASPWHNMSKITQIIGRGVRNCSHRSLPIQDRDVVVFRYSVANPEKRMKEIPKEFYEVETSDENFWRNSELKDVAIKSVERELKRNAIDCSVHKGMNIFPGDKDYSRNCDYQKCMYECRGHQGKKRKVDDSTALLLFNRNEIENVKFAIAKLFETRNVYTFADIKQVYKKSKKKVSDRSIAIALQEMLNGLNGPELIRGRNGASGHLIYVSKYYMFQPLYALDDRIPLAMRSQLPTRQFKAARLDLQEQASTMTINTDEILERLDNIPDLILQFEELDKSLMKLDDHRDLLEAIIMVDPQHHLLKYYRNFLLFDENNAIKGHFLSNTPRILTKQGAWTVGSISDRKRMENVISNLYQEPDADFVGYYETKGSDSNFKIINNLEQRDKTRLNLKKALNTLTTGKTCNTFERVILNTVANFLGVITSRQENRKSLCERIEYAFRKKQLENIDGRRYFYNGIEASQHLMLSKS